MSDLSRRKFVKNASIAAGASSLAFSSIQASAGDTYYNNLEGVGYGPLSPKKDQATGLYLLSLPEGFEYKSFGWTGQIMDDGRPTPTDHDGMAVVRQWRNYISIVRNHELSAGESTQCYVPGGMYNENEFGGTTSLCFDLDTGEFVKSETSLGGTIRNCAGGPTPWSSWISCEETFHPWNSRSDGYNHGYIFDVPGFGISDGLPIRAAGRFAHEAVAVDPRSGIVYETEDARDSAFYRYVQPGAGSKNWRNGRGKLQTLSDNGELYAMVVNEESRKDLKNRNGLIKEGDSFPVTWELVADPEAQFGRTFDSSPNAAVLSRGEGCWEDHGSIYFVSTDGGPANLGQVWEYCTAEEELTLVFEADDASEVDGPDNIAVSPRGGIILCEDGDSNPKRMVGLSHHGEIFQFCENNVVLADGDIDTVDAVFPGTKENFWDDHVGDFRSREWAGATFYDNWLFANIQSPGITFAITGPWEKGKL